MKEQISTDSLNQLNAFKAVVFSEDVQIKKHSFSGNHVRSKRTSIELFSEASQRRLLFLARNSGHFIKSQICLTYHFAMPDSGHIVKEQLNNFLTQMRRQYPDIRYIWVLEFQKRGVPHFHLFTSICPSNTAFRDWCAKVWNQVCGEDAKHLAFQGHPRNFVPWCMVSGKYLVKQYLAKISQKFVPEEYHSVGRFWGNSRNMTPKSFDLEPFVDCTLEAFKKAVRTVTKLRERILSKWVKINYRKRSKSYSLTSSTTAFIQLIQFYENQEIRG